MKETTITSVGIDIGTTTTQLVFSALTLCNVAGVAQVPRYAITDRAILYASPVVFTPKQRSAVTRGDAARVGGEAEDTLDAPALAGRIRSWYAAAGIRPEAVTTGAVIVTGESLKTPNARETVMGVADALGDFVVATAGPNLESVIAGRGSGAAELSRQHRSTVLNIDIGGGTSNYAVFQHGQVVDTACLNVGGRLLECAPDGGIERIAAPAGVVLRELFGGLPRRLARGELAAVADRMADLIHEVAVGRPSSLARALLQTPPLGPWSFEAVTLSGGVGACCQEPPEEVFRYGDMGPLLAAALLRHPGLRALPLTPPATTVRATVIGAGSWSLSLSGSTVWTEEDALPLKNLPVVPIPLTWPRVPRDLAGWFRERVGLHDLDAAAAPFALAFAGTPATYAAVTTLADGLVRFCADGPGVAHPLIVVLAEDIGKALGMELRARLPGRTLIVLDEVRLAEGDYLDLGKPLGGGDVVPIIIKSLAFSSKHDGTEA